MRRRRERGFTLIEVVVIAPIMMVAIAITITFIINVMLNIGAKNAQTALQLEAQLALFNLKDDILFANYFEYTATDSNAPAGGWKAVTVTGGVASTKALVISEVAYTANRQSADRQIVRIKDAPAPCGTEASNHNQLSTNTLIYFVSNSKLYRRTLVPPQSDNCSQTYRKQSCPTAVSGCVADLLMAENVKSFTVTYYSNKIGDPDAPVTSNAVLTDERRYIRFTKADINLTLERMISGEPVTTNAKITLKKAE